MEPKVNFQMIDLQVEEVLGGCNLTIKPNVCHYYVEIQGQFDDLQECNT
jgi:hypothetical protein